jgi:hypothetical protein
MATAKHNRAVKAHSVRSKKSSVKAGQALFALSDVNLSSLFLAQRIERLPRAVRNDILTQIDEAQPKGRRPARRAP